VVLACYFAHLLAGFPARSALRLRRQSLVRPSFRLHPRLKPVAFLTRPALPAVPPVSAPLQEFSILRDQRINWLRNRSVRLPESPDLRSLPAAFPFEIRLRITVPDPLHFRRSFEDLVCSVTRSQLCHPFRLRNCEQSPHRHPPSGLSMSC